MNTLREKALRIAIAEKCGWESHGPCLFYHPIYGQRTCYRTDGDIASVLPNYPGSLDAMHEAEKVLTVEQAYDYGDALAMLVRHPENIAFKDKPNRRFPLNGWGHFHVAHLTALQRAEAFCKACGLEQRVREIEASL